ncbi:MAG: cycloisomerase [Candidatus Thiodiazotropha sp. (ex Codakia orbicularis)]|nr:cycloisomerase [Candidatus Thiodiazotropha sp. (ex Codakia orbicularis)]
MYMRFLKSVAPLCLLGGLVSTAALAETSIWQTDEFNIPEANQGVGVDEDHFYAVDNRTIAKYRKSGDYVTAWEGDSDGPIIHLDSAAVIDGKIYCSHSSYRYLPMTSSIEVWDAETMAHIESHSLGIQLGSLTWLDRHGGYWWGTFANYNKEAKLPDGSPAGIPYAIRAGGNINTTLVKFDEDWDLLESWIFPMELLEKFERMSNSGGSWGPDGNLYVTGHDLAEIYRIRFPEAGSILEVAETIPLNIRGQGVAWDRSRPGTLYGIIRATDEEEAQGMTNRVVVFGSDVPQKEASECRPGNKRDGDERACRRRERD